MFFELFEEETAGLRLAPLADVQPQARLEAPRAAVVDSWLPLVQVLDVTVPQNVDDEVMALYITKHVAVVMVGVPEFVEPFSGVHRGGPATVQMVEELEHAHAPSPLRSSFPGAGHGVSPSVPPRRSCVAEQTLGQDVSKVGLWGLELAVDFPVPRVVVRNVKQIADIPVPVGQFSGISGFWRGEVCAGGPRELHGASSSSSLVSLDTAGYGFFRTFSPPPKSAKVPWQLMPALGVPVLNRPDEDVEQFWMVRILRSLVHLGPSAQYAHAFELHGYVQGERRLVADDYGSSVSEEGSEEDAHVTAVDLLTMSMEERREYLRSLPMDERRELLRAQQSVSKKRWTCDASPLASVWVRFLRQSTEALCSISLSSLRCSCCSFTCGYLVHYFLLVHVYGSHFLGVRVLLFEYCILDSWEDDALHGGFWKNFSQFPHRG